MQRFQLSCMMLCVSLLAFGAQAADCMQIRFAPGASSVEIRGEAPPNDVLCYEMRTGGGQDARIRVLEGRNTFVSVEGVADAQTDSSFTTEPRTYRLRVGQLMRAARPEAFRLLVSVK